MDCLTSAWKRLRYHDQQAQLWRTTARFVAVAAGRGSGKTELARRRIVRFLPVKKEWAVPKYFYALPTVAQAKKIAWPHFNPESEECLIPQDWIRKVDQTNLEVHTVFGSKLFVLGMDKPQRAEGVQYDGGVIDESSDQKPGVFDRTFLPAMSERGAWCWRIGVPKRTGIGAKDFKRFYDIGIQNKTIPGTNTRISSFCWPSEDILTEEEIRIAQETLDSQDYDEQYRANWLDISGRIFHAFDERYNVEEVSYRPEYQLVVGCDFNVNPMAWVIGHIANEKLYIHDEIWLRNTNTERTCEYLSKRYSDHKSGWLFFGDASGRARKTAATFTDYAIIKNFTGIREKLLRFPKSNPGVANRFAACNALFCNTLGNRRCFISPKCKHLISDLKERSYVEGTREPDDYGDVGHITDALGYIIHRRFPLRAKVYSGCPEAGVMENVA